jgi:hypothetical protein
MLLLLRSTFAVTLVLLAADIAGACCVPPKLRSMSGTLVYHFAGGALAWTETDKNDFRQAANAWNSLLQSNGSSIQFQESSSSGLPVKWDLIGGGLGARMVGPVESH